MRKAFLVVLIAGLAAGTVLAQEVTTGAAKITISGGVQQAWGFGDGAYQNFDAINDLPGADVDLDFKVEVDAINTVVINLEQAALKPVVTKVAPATTTTGLTIETTKVGIPFVQIADAYWDTDLATALGLEGLTVTTRIGYWEAGNYNVSNVTGIKFENVAASAERNAAIQLEVGSGDLVNLRFVAIPGNAPGKNDFAQDKDGLDGLIAAKSAVGPVSVELFYSSFGDQAPGNGEIGFGVGYSQELVPGLLDLSVGADLEYDLNPAGVSTNAELAASGRTLANNYPEAQLMYGFGVSAGLLDGLATLGISTKGAQFKDSDKAGTRIKGGRDTTPAALAEAEKLSKYDFMPYALGVDLNVAPADFVGFDVALVLGLDDRFATPLQYSEFSTYLKAGAATVRVGYAFYADDGDKDKDRVGFYDPAKGKADYLYKDYKAGGFIEGAKSGFAFINTEIKF